MIKKIKNIILKTDQFFYKKFGSDKSTKVLENIKEAEVLFSLINLDVGDDKIRFVGGCVRKSMCGEIIDDVDLATTLTPQEIKLKLNKKNIKIIDTGIAHGTVTVIINNKKFEITTLRKDISTDGRHANVQFTSNWKEDASRRDFTINAIYSDIDGRIFDPHNGILDLQNGNVEFIGSAEERIQEDYLRILRYFRFFVQYSKRKHNEKTLKLIKNHINGINKVSNERIIDEFRKILKLKRLYNLFSEKNSQEIILNIFPQFKYYKRLKVFNELNKDFKKNYDDNLILALIILDKTNNYDYFCHKYKLSNKIKKRFKNISDNYEKIKSNEFYNEKNIKKLIYLSNREYVLDLLLFSICENLKIKKINIEKLINYVVSCKIPKFPITGDYLKKHGYKPGELMGKKLKFLEEKWIQNNFVMEKKYLQDL